MKKSTIIIDLDNTLIEAVFFDEIKGKVANYTIVTKCDNINSYFCLFERNHLDEFLLTANKTFSQVIIWSAGKRNYVETVCLRIFSRVNYFPHAILTREDCLSINGTYVKPLEKIFVEYDADPSKTFIIDDSKNIRHSNEKYSSNCIQIPPFISSKGNDNILKLLKDWMISKNNNISPLLKVDRSGNN